MIVGIFVIALSYQEAEASHTGFFAGINIIRGVTPVENYNERPDCPFLNCHVHFDELNKRDFKRFLRWCETDRIIVEIPNGDSVAGEPRFGKGPWQIFGIAVSTTDGVQSINTHDTLTVTLHVHEP